MSQDDHEYVRLTWQDIQISCFHIFSQMNADGYKPQSIIGLLRGGVVPARIFSDFFDILLDFYALDVKLYTNIGVADSNPRIRPFYGDVKGKSILIVDDIWDSGKTMNAVLDYLKEETVKTATVCWKETAEKKPDYYSRVVRKNEWMVYPWETYEFERQLNQGRETDG